MQEIAKYSSPIFTSESKVLTVYLMLIHRQQVNYDTVYNFFGCTRRTLYRIIATIKDSLEQSGIFGQIIYDMRLNSYILIKVSQN